MQKYFAPYQIWSGFLGSNWCTVYSALVKITPDTSPSLESTASTNSKVIHSLVAKWILITALLALIVPGVGIALDDDSLFCAVLGEVETTALRFPPKLSHWIGPQPFVPLQRDQGESGLAMRAPPLRLVGGVGA